MLPGISFDVKPGELHALMGKNGAGKSRLMKNLAVVHRAIDTGHFRYGKTGLRDPKIAAVLDD